MNLLQKSIVHKHNNLKITTYLVQILKLILYKHNKHNLNIQIKFEVFVYVTVCSNNSVLWLNFISPILKLLNTVIVKFMVDQKTQFCE